MPGWQLQQGALGGAILTLGPAHFAPCQPLIAAPREAAVTCIAQG